MIEKRILLSFYLMLLIGFGTNLVAHIEYRPFYKKFLTPPLFFKNKRLKQLEVLAAFYIKIAIDYADEVNNEVELKARIPISPKLRSLIEEILSRPREEELEKALLYLKEAILSFRTNTNRGIRVIRIYQKHEKLDKTQSEGFLQAALFLLKERYKEIINAIDKLGIKTKLPREITVEILSSFSQNGPSRFH